MIWGLSLEPGCIYTRSVPVPTHLSLATLDCRGKVYPGTDPVKVSHVVLKTPSCEQLVCSLVQGLVLQQQLNLQLMPNEEVAFSNQGNCCVYITGYSSMASDEHSLEDDTSIYPSEEGSIDNEATTSYEENTGWLAEDVPCENGSQTMDDVDREPASPCSSSEIMEPAAPNTDKVPDENDSPHPVDVICIAIKEEPVDGDQSGPSRGNTPQPGPPTSDGDQGGPHMQYSDGCESGVSGRPVGTQPLQSQTKSCTSRTSEAVTSEHNDLTEITTSGQDVYANGSSSSTECLPKMEPGMADNPRFSINEWYDRNLEHCNKMLTLVPKLSETQVCQTSCRREETSRESNVPYTPPSGEQMEHGKLLENCVQTQRRNTCSRTESAIGNLTRKGWHLLEVIQNKSQCAISNLNRSAQRSSEGTQDVSNKAQFAINHPCWNEEPSPEVRQYKDSKGQCVIGHPDRNEQQSPEVTQNMCNKVQSAIGDPSRNEKQSQEVTHDIRSKRQHVICRPDPNGQQSRDVTQKLGNKGQRAAIRRRSHDPVTPPEGSRCPRFQCGFCPKSLNCRRSLQNHEMIHTGVRPWQCRFCQKTFIQKSQWKVHERIHTGIKPFVCVRCGKAFSRRYNERMHAQVCAGYFEKGPARVSRGKSD